MYFILKANWEKDKPAEGLTTFVIHTTKTITLKIY